MVRRARGVSGRGDCGEQAGGGRSSVGRWWGKQEMGCERACGGSIEWRREERHGGGVA